MTTDTSKTTAPATPAPAPLATAAPKHDLSTYQGKLAHLADYLQHPTMVAGLKAVATDSLRPERIIKVVLAAASRNPRLLECTPASIVLAMRQAAELGLEPSSGLGEAYLVPYKNNKKVGNAWQTTIEAQFQPGYKGLAKLARRSGEISTLTMRVVYKKDTFKVRYGLNEEMEHIPFLDGDPGELAFVYAIATFKDGGRQWEVMSKDQVEKIRARSKAKDDGPWKTDYEPMAMKTVMKKLCKLLPMSADSPLARAVEIDNEVDGDIHPLSSATLTVPEELPTLPPAAEKKGAEMQDKVEKAAAATAPHAEAATQAAKPSEPPPASPAATPAPSAAAPATVKDEVGNFIIVSEDGVVEGQFDECMRVEAQAKFLRLSGRTEMPDGWTIEKIVE
jgi:recombination protein RecT